MEGFNMRKFGYYVLLLLCSTGMVIALAKDSKQSSCGGNIEVKSPGYLTSPGYPITYFSSQKCFWLIQAAESYQKILLNFNPHFDLEDRDCKYDYVEVYDGKDEKAPLLGKFCGKIAPSQVNSKGPAIFVKFVSDYETHGAGFSIRYEILKTAPECSRNFTTSTGVITSPRYPEKYGNNLECTYVIFAPGYSEILLEFESFELEPDTSAPVGVQCRYDRVDIWDGLPGAGPHIGRYCGSNIPRTIRAITGILSIVLQTDNAIAREGFLANFSVTQSQPPDFECLEPLGMQSGTILSDHITASTEYNAMWSSDRARLNYPENGWTPGDDSSKEWIQVDLQVLRFVSAIGTQGAVSSVTGKKYFVKSYKIDVSSNGDDWSLIKEGKNAKIFEGNSDATNVVVSKLPVATLARFVRIRPITWETGIALKFELYGCKIADYPCSGMLGMASGLILDNQIVSSNISDQTWIPENARLLLSRSGWIVPKSELPYHRHYLQIDLGDEKIVRGLIIQGGKVHDDKLFMKTFKVATSSDGKLWEVKRNPTSNRVQVFEGNSNADTPIFVNLDSILTRYIKITPDKATNQGLALRLEVLGCDREAPTSSPPTADHGPVDDCEDDQSICYSGTGDDYDSPGGSTSSTTEGTLTDDTTKILGTVEAEHSNFDCNFEWGQNQTICNWRHDTQTNLKWMVRSDSTTTSEIEHVTPYTKKSKYITTDNTGKRNGEVARLLSPFIFPKHSTYCISFWYRVSTARGMLRILLREFLTKNTVDHVLWSHSGHQVTHWKESHISLHHPPKLYQVIIEGHIGEDEGDIAVDDVAIQDSVPCTDTPVELPYSPTETTDLLSPVDVTDDDDIFGASSGTDIDDTEINSTKGNVLKTLDPILITIIAMSALGVLLGAICGVVLYCACWHNGMAERNLSALENYNFELVDGVKQKKDKLNLQNSYSEA
ncbi:neuropilin-1 [Protopterus annectens]|uniref:neuropilin-1 n=1 Tax=Protopterus annectens TaxID=7888 RepID=UPI001CFC1FBF|nr:neuropilin-1 [Protopterus annectens]